MPALRGPIILDILGPVRGEHTTILEEPAEPRAFRRRFLSNLASIADYDKGVIPVTAIGLEDAPLGTLSWSRRIPDSIEAHQTSWTQL